MQITTDIECSKIGLVPNSIGFGCNRLKSYIESACYINSQDMKSLSHTVFYWLISVFGRSLFICFWTKWSTKYQNDRIKRLYDWSFSENIFYHAHISKNLIRDLFSHVKNNTIHIFYVFRKAPLSHFISFLLKSVTLNYDTAHVWNFNLKSTFSCFYVP